MAPRLPYPDPDAELQARIAVPAPSPEELNSLRAVEYLGKSPKMRKRLLWLAGILYGAMNAVGGWYGHEITNKLEIDSLRASAAVQAGTIAVLKSQTADLQAALKALTDVRLTVISHEIRVIRRNFVVVTAAAYAGEPAPKRKQKTKVATDFGAYYDDQIDQGLSPAAAEQLVLAKIAIP